MPQRDVEKGLRDGTLLKGKLRINARRRSTAFVTADGGVLLSDIFLESEKARNRAQEGDLVVVELAPVTEWMPLKQAPARSSIAGLAAALESISITENSAGADETKGATSCPAWDGPEVAPPVDGLWRPSPKVAGGAQGGNRSDNLCEAGVLAAQGNLQPRGKVVFIMESAHREDHMGSLVWSSPLKADGKLSDKDSYVMFHPTDRRVPHMLVARGELPSIFVDNPGAYANSIFMACVKGTWSATSKLPWGHNVRFVGEAGAIHAETKALLCQNGVNHGDFPRTVLRGLEAFLPPKNAEDGIDAGADIRGSRWKIPEEEISKRRDLRATRIFTIDPTGARDLDDALSITPLADGTFEIGVHIADVTYFVRPNSDLDREARRRATTVYLVQQAIPMLPPLLCEELCSLNPQVDRLTYSCIWRMNVDGTLVDKPAWFGRTVIRSCCKLDYQTAQYMIEGTILPDSASSTSPELWDRNRRPTEFTCGEVCQDVLLMNSLAKRRRAKRFESGALSLNTPKLTFKLDDNGNPADFGSYPIRDSNRLVEEYMLLANFLVAQQMVEGADDRAFLRMHPPPISPGLNALKETLAGCGIEIDITSSGSIQASLLRLRTQCNDEEIAQVCTMMATIPMQNAEYVAAGAADSWRHYALNIPVYTHFTSPIRRYADVMVHRILTATLDGTVESSYEVDAIEKTAQHCNYKRLAAKAAQERSDEVYLAVHVASNPLEEEAVVISVGEQSFTVNIPRLGVTSRLFLDKIPDIAATYDELEGTIHLTASSTVTHQWTDAKIKIFAKVQVLCTVAEKTGPIEILLQFLRPK
ncbi:conserved unknown protein [Ectocarpus siliculosus]|uniref:RNB domain-containing protein n=1 Tax=Ectocarpus siliculosus TaxID=2880 RepID=D8LBE7_ECTSI|nr:conserved unknown protein [Ectocarpus siliculosus]|eukprot:CBN76656.1 conserved unknown protein [Ectocarpus siliculosus]